MSGRLSQKSFPAIKTMSPSFFSLSECKNLVNWIVKVKHRNSVLEKCSIKSWCKLWNSHHTRHPDLTSKYNYNTVKVISGDIFWTASWRQRHQSLCKSQLERFPFQWKSLRANCKVLLLGSGLLILFLLITNTCLVFLLRTCQWEFTCSYFLEVSIRPQTVHQILNGIRKKLESQNLLDGCLRKIWLLDFREKGKPGWMYAECEYLKFITPL